MEVLATNDNLFQGNKDVALSSDKPAVKSIDDPKPASDKKQEKDYSKEEVKNELENLNKWLASKNSHLKFVLHDKLNKYYVQVISDDSNEVVKEMPPKKVMDAIAEFHEYIGILVDKKI